MDEQAFSGESVVLGLGRLDRIVFKSANLRLCFQDCQSGRLVAFRIFLLFLHMSVWFSLMQRPTRNLQRTYLKGDS